MLREIQDTSYKLQERGRRFISLAAEIIGESWIIT
jgi:hypothetical protein